MYVQIPGLGGAFDNELPKHVKSRAVIAFKRGNSLKPALFFREQD